jgi:hypothetical protein
VINALYSDPLLHLFGKDLLFEADGSIQSVANINLDEDHRQELQQSMKREAKAYYATLFDPNFPERAKELVDYARTWIDMNPKLKSTVIANHLFGMWKDTTRHRMAQDAMIYALAQLVDEYGEFFDFEINLNHLLCALGFERGTQLGRGATSDHFAAPHIATCKVLEAAGLVGHTVDLTTGGIVLIRELLEQEKNVGLMLLKKKVLISLTLEHRPHW